MSVLRSIGSTAIRPPLPARRPSRRATLGGLAAVGLGAVAPTLAAGPARAAAAPLGATALADPVQLTLPAPTGPYRIGNVALHLIDRSRRDPWVPSHPPRELMIGVWYPARDVALFAMPSDPPRRGYRPDACL